MGHCRQSAERKMPGRRMTAQSFAAFVACGLCIGFSSHVAAQVSPQFELSETVHLDEADSGTRAHLERVKAYVADGQWDEAVETLRQVMETHGAKVVAVAPGRYVSVADYCHLQIAALPPEALELYRGRVDPLADKWYSEALAARDGKRLEQIIDQAFCSSWGDDALWTLGEISLERGEHGAARRYWESLIQEPPATLDVEQYRHAVEHGGLDPADYELLTKWYQRDTSIEPPLYRLAQSPPPTDAESAKLVRIWNRLRLPARRLTYPDTTIALEEIRARLILVSIMEGNFARAKSEIAAYTEAYPNAEGTLAGRKTNFAKGLAAILAAAEKWPAPRGDQDWPTFAGNFARNGIGEAIKEVRGFAWKQPLDLGETVSADIANNRAFSYLRVGEDASALLSYHPVVVGDLVLWCNHRYVYAFNLKTGKPAFQNDPSKPLGVIYDIETNVAQSVRPHRGLGVPRYTLTVHDDKIYARFGSQVTSRPVDAFEQQQGYLVCLDLAAEGKLLWPWPLTSTADRWSYEGPPVVDGSNVYIAMRRSDVRPQAYVACLDAETGQQRWRTFVCAAETPGGGQSDEITHNLLTLNEGVLYFNTNLGAVAALSARDGRTKWIRLYNRARKVNSEGIDQRAHHFYRDLNPCVYCQGLVYAAPSDSEWILAIDAATGQIAWESRLPEDAIHLLGVADGTLMASGNKLWWLDATGGKVKARWPGTTPGGYGRGVVATDQVLWTSRDALYSFNLAVPSGALPSMRRSSMQLASVYHATGGNLLLARDRLLLATPNKLYAFSVIPQRTESK
jgi:outer membrane protein assembly factor BamB